MNSVQNMTTEVTKRRHYGYEATRQAILDTARAIMREEGVAALSLHEVARRMGMKTPSLYTYFDSKHALYDALFALGMKMQCAMMQEIMTRDDSLEAKIEAGIEGYMRFADDHPELYPLLFERPVPGFVPSETALTDIRQLMQDGAAVFQQAIDAGLMAPGLTAQQTQDVFLAVMHGLTALKRANEPDAPTGEGRFGSLIPAAAQLLFAAWLTPAANGGVKKSDE
jgi:AcrR family transcriptional regulator